MSLRDLGCPDCKQVTSGDCGNHGPLVVSGSSLICGSAEASPSRTGERLPERLQERIQAGREVLAAIRTAEQERDVWKESAHIEKRRSDEFDEQLAKAEQERDAWKNAVIDAAIVNWTYVKRHEQNPREAVNALLCQAQQEALDPAISEPAAKLIQRAGEAEAQLAARDQTIAQLREALETLRDGPQGDLEWQSNVIRAALTPPADGPRT